ncbi:alpha/beta hydrolase [Glaciihabitans sp. INWT7]|uniref:alpha/beta fold hydrolase n=1 Tax=Glaciihabitans sp. INWT7 TaxID=2596912 RepID=UPI001628BD24|nr:alpha/beta hydrolase [Glaciihabitans sp. INWT7]QNE47081.1 alpha/beta hydrolase [Glaciihabitans sp. INWT7]
MSIVTVENYAPFELLSDPAALGLATTTVSSPLGTCVARHPARRTSTRATLFLHGAAGSWTTWTPLLQAAVADRIDLGDIVVFDLPGWGDASLAEGSVDDPVFAICSLVKDMAEELGYTEWDIVGHSLGGFIALHMASIWPQAVLSVGMVSGTTFSIIHSVEHPVRRFGELPGFTMLWRVMQFLALLGRAGPALVRGIGGIGLLRPATFPLFRHWRAVPRSQGHALAIEIRPRSFATAAAVTRGYDADSLWSRIECPVRATKGDRDVFVTQEDLDHLGRLLPSSLRTVIPDCGHFGAVERPRAVLSALGYTED